MEKTTSSTKGQEYNHVFTDQLAKFISYSGHEHELPRKYHKFFVDNGVILKQFSKKNNLKLEQVEALVKSNLYFELDFVHVEEGFFSKSKKDQSIARFTDMALLERLYKTKRRKMFVDAKGSNVLLTRLTHVIKSISLKELKPDGSDMDKQAYYRKPKWT